MLQAKSEVGVDMSQVTPEASASGTGHSPRKTAKMQLLLNCPRCSFTGSNQKYCLSHICDKHLDYRFPCNFCDRLFKVYNTKYRHEQEHREQPSHICADCGMAFLYESELNRHVGVHNDVLPYPCEKCTKCFASKKSKDRHFRSHGEQSIKCKCGKISTSHEKHYTYFRGAHGKSYDSKCGKNFQWPAGRARHQNKCTTCKEIIARESAKKKLLRTPAQKDALDYSVPKKKCKIDSDAEQGVNTVNKNSEDSDELLETKRQINLKIEKLKTGKKVKYMHQLKTFL